jgi:hypothetical protein
VKIERNTKTSFSNRNKIRTAQGWSWLTVPVSRGDKPEDELINNVRIDSNHWQKKHLRSLTQSYSRAPCYHDYHSWFEYFYEQEWTHLAPMLKESTQHLLDVLGIKTPFLYGSEMDVSGKKSDLILNYCKTAGATTYLSGPFGRDYLDAASFDKADIEIKYHDYTHPEYMQKHGEFIPYISVVDLIFNHGSGSCRILRGEE